MSPSPPVNKERDRLAALHAYGVLDTPSEEAFDELAQLAADICEVPIALITLIDDKRQWFKSRVGLAIEETPRDVAFCTHAIGQSGLLIIADAAADERFAANPLVTDDPRIRFYAGAPLITPEGHALGTLCVIDRKPREMSAAQQRALRVLGRHVMTQLELKRKAREAAQADGPRLTLLSILEDQMQAQVIERQSTQRLVGTLENMKDGFIALDRKWHFTYVNAGAAQSMGKDRNLLIGKSIFPEFANGHFKPFYDASQLAMAKQETTEFETFHLPLQAWIHGRVHPTPDGLAIFLSDVTQRRQSEAALREKEEQLRIAVAASNVGFWSRDLASNQVFFSPQWKQHLGYADDEMPNHYAEWESRLHPDERADVVANEKSLLASQLTHAETEFRLRHKDGSYRWIYMRTECLRDGDGKALRMTGCHIDITERKRTEEALHLSSDKLHELTRQLIATEENERRNLSRELHDRVGQNLSAINLSLNVIDARLSRDGIKSVLRDIDDAHKLVEETIQHTRNVMAELRPPALDDFGVLAALRLHAAQMSARTGTRIDVLGDDPNPRLPLVLDTALFRIAQEALINASKHAHATLIVVELVASQEHVELNITDNGAGFDMAAPQTRASWGMQTMRERAMSIGATLRVESAPGRGTRVTIETTAVVK